MPTTIFGVSIKHILVIVILGWAIGYLLDRFLEPSPENQALEAFIRSEEQVTERVGAVIDIALVRQVVAYPGYGPAGDTPGYTRSMFSVEGERGRLIVTLKAVEGEQAIQMTEIRSP